MFVKAVQPDSGFIECVIRSNKLKPILAILGKLLSAVKPNEDMELNFAGPLLIFWGAKQCACAHRSFFLNVSRPRLQLAPYQKLSSFFYNFT